MWQIVRREVDSQGRAWLKTLVRDENNEVRKFQSSREARRFAEYLRVGAPEKVQYALQRA